MRKHLEMVRARTWPSGEVAGIGEPEVDRFNAQMIAAAMYVQAESEQLNSI